LAFVGGGGLGLSNSIEVYVPGKGGNSGPGGSIVVNGGHFITINLFGSGGGFGGFFGYATTATQSAMREPQRGEATTACTFEPLSKSDAETVDGIRNDKDVSSAMLSSWMKTLWTGNENGFFIYKDNTGYRAGPNVTGGPTTMGPRFFLYALGGGSGAVANYHTHPGVDPLSGQASRGDSNFAQRTQTISLIQTAFGLISGRECK
jgi:hypothetical protein